MERAAVTGPEYSGKSTLLAALGSSGSSHKRLHTVYPVEDDVLVRLAEAEGSSKVTPVRIEYEEVPSTSPGALREFDCLVVVVRPEAGTDAPDSTVAAASRQAKDFVAELIVSDLALIEGALVRLKKVAATGDREARAVVDSSGPLIEALENQDLRAAASIASDPSAVPKDWGLLCAKPVVVVVNLEEGVSPESSRIEQAVAEALGETASGVLASPLALEAELSQMSEGEASELRDIYSLGSPIGSRLAPVVLEATGSIVFYTANENEARAWTLREGATALEAAGRIHSDMERGFIRAEVVSAEDLLRAGSFKEARKAGAVRTEGKGYVVRPSDVLWIRFAV